MLGLGYSQGRKVETDTLKARYAFKIRLSGTWYDRSSFFGYLNGSNQLTLSGLADNAINSSKIVDASIANADIVDPWVYITAGSGLYITSSAINLGQSVTMSVNTDDSTITVTNDTLHVIGGGGGLDSAEVRSKFFPITDSDIDSLYSAVKVKGSAVELNSNSVLSDSAGLKVNIDPIYFSVSGADAIDDKWYSKNAGVGRLNFEFNQKIVNDTIYYPIPQTEASGYLDAWGASGGETLYIFNRAGDSQNFVLTTDSTRYNVNTITFAANDSFYIYTAGTAYIDNVYLVSPRSLTLADSGISGDKIGTAEVEYLHLDDALRDSLAAWKVTISDTNDLKSYTGSAQHVSLLKLSSSNSRGGGDFTKYSTIPWGSAADGVTLFAASGGGYWGRDAFKDNSEIVAAWAGATGDGVTDDIDMIHRARDVAIELDVPLHLTEGYYKITDPIEDGLTSFLTKDFFIYGDGVGRTYIIATDTAFNFNHSGGYTRAINVEDMSIVGPGSGTANSVGIYVNRLSSPNFRRLQPTGFENLVTGTQLEASYWERVVWGACSTAVNLRAGTTLNGNTFESCSNTTEVINTVYDWGTGYGNLIHGGEGGNCKIFLRTDGTNFSQITIDGMNLESCDSTFVITSNNCQVGIKNSRFLNVGGTNTKYFVEGYGTSETMFDNVEFQGDFPQVLQSGSSSKFFDKNVKNKVKFIYSLTNNTYYTMTPWDWFFDNSALTADTSAAGRFTRVIPRKSVSATTPEKMIYSGRFSNTEIGQYHITDIDIRGTNNTILTAQPGPIHNYRRVYRWGNVTFGAGDSTEVEIVADTMGWAASTKLYANAVLDMAGNATMYNVTASVKTENRTAGVGTVTFVLWHNGISMSGVTRRVLFQFVFYPNKWAQ